MNTVASERARFVRSRLPAGGLFAGQTWRTAPGPFRLEPDLAGQLETLGRVLLQFNRAVNLLYRLSVAGKQPEWIAHWLDLGKPPELIAWQRSPEFKNDLPRVIRPDLLLTDSGFSITELDSVPGGIGVTAWLNQTYAALPISAPINAPPQARTPALDSGQPEVAEDNAIEIIGAADGMFRGFAGIFGEAPHVHVVVSEESATYLPEMHWLCGQLSPGRFAVRDARFTGWADGDAVYRFFELFDLPNVENARLIIERAREKRIRLTPPPKPVFEEKMLWALLWNRHLRGFWRQELGEGFWQRLLEHVPYSWIMDPAPLPPHAAIPELNLTDWHQLKTLSNRERELIIKVSGFSESAWGSRGVYLGSDLPADQWSEAVDRALRQFSSSPHVLQRYHKPRVIETEWYDFERDEVKSMPGRVRLCPYYFVMGEGEAARAHLGGVLATICPADKKIIHGMSDAVLAPCAAIRASTRPRK